MRITESQVSHATQSSANFNKSKAKHPAKKKHLSFFKVTLAIYSLIMLGLGGRVIWQYQHTQKWHFNQINGHMNKIPPEFAKNIYSIGMSDALNRLSAVNQSLANYQQDNGLTTDTIKSARQALTLSQTILKHYQITGGQSYQNQKNLALDIKIYDLEQSAYQHLQTKSLVHILNQVIQRNADNHTDSDKVVIKRLNTINNDYAKLNQFLNQQVTKIGVIKGHQLMIYPNIHPKDINDTIKLIKQYNLARFPAVLHLQLLLFNQQTQNVMKNNQAIVDEQVWKRILGQLLRLSQTDYRSPRQIKTLKDANQYHFATSIPNHPDNLAVRDDSIVKSLTYDGQKINPHQYFKVGLNLTATIDPSYKVVPLPKDDDDGNSDVTNSSTSDNSSASDQSSTSDKTNHKTNDNSMANTTSSHATSHSTNSSTPSSANASSTDTTKASSSSSVNATNQALNQDNGN